MLDHPYKRHEVADKFKPMVNFFEVSFIFVSSYLEEFLSAVTMGILLNNKRNRSSYSLKDGQIKQLIFKPGRKVKVVVYNV